MEIKTPTRNGETGLKSLFCTLINYKLKIDIAEMFGDDCFSVGSEVVSVKLTT